MNKSPESQSPKLKAIRSRWLACTQSTGRVGKSTAAEGIITDTHSTIAREGEVSLNDYDQSAATLQYHLRHGNTG